MKFLCEQCKAKYQISDDKVAGKTVRMKCRKCGHMIEVRAEVTETSVSRGMPKELQARAAAEGSATGSGAHAASTATAAGTSGAPVRTPPPSPSRPANSPRPPATGEGHATNSKGASPLATSLSARKPMAPRSLITPPPTPAQNAGEATMVAPPPHSGAGAPGALAGAFQKSIVKDDPALRDITGLKEWYVAINGVPVGPVRIAELRRKASLGAVTEDSLVWQEGMEEWRPVKAYSELLALVREAAQSGRPPLAVTGDVRQSTPPPPGKGAYVPRGAVALNRGPAAPGVGVGGDNFRPARSNVLPFAPRNAAAEKLEDPEATEVATQALQQPSHTIQTPVPPEAVDPFAVPTAGGPKAQEDPFRAGPPAGTSRPPLSVQISPASGNVISPFAGTSSPGPAPNFASNVGDRSSVSLGPPILATEPPPQKKGVPWIPLAMVALAGAFGITAAIVIFRQPAQAPAAPPAPAAASSTPPVASTPPPPASAEIELPAEPAASASAEKGPSTGPKVAAGTPKPATSASNGSKTADLSDLLKGTGSGPSSGSGGGGGASAGGGSLSEDQIRSVLNQHQLGVRRNCWERGSTSQQSSVNVNVRMVINGQGQVTSANADGNDPAIAKCIETSVRNWSFPATGGTSTVNIPFKFVRQ
ncbi:zinc-ribbon domain-containing protein [Pendulispora brunnea]|uniref:Zinc-ribbon domain-containing protein n=1 Tax=Pendulispora brunnea TaxID=2905690 RepID=A0ABZ2KN54_9BACT